MDSRDLIDALYGVYLGPINEPADAVRIIREAYLLFTAQYEQAIAGKNDTFPPDGWLPLR
ncbi:MAG: hypothetical protein JW881_08240 [Spirochaetales bacterium]|nr:hypothetical protein [Spirochaetales bacterium]